MTRYFGLALVALLVGCAGRSGLEASTVGWIRVETEDLVIRTDVGREKAVRLAASYQRLRTAIAENELPCAFERSNVPMEFVLLKDPRDIEDLAGRHTAGFSARPPSSYLDAKLQLVMDSRQAAIDSQLFVHELTHGAVAICFPGGRPWLHEGMASFYETARIDGGELILGMPAYGFVPMTNVEPMFDIYPVRANGAEVWTYLTRLARGDDEDKAWAGAFAGVDVASRCRDYLDVEYKMGGRAISVAAPRQPTVHPMSQLDVALLRSRLYAWRSEEGAKAALEYLELAASKDPSASNVMLHKAALHLEAGREQEGWAWLERAIEQASADPQVAATAVLWFAGKDGAASERARLDAWARTLRVSAQTAFQLAALGEYFVRVAGDPSSGFESLQRSLTLDATSWRTYALMGEALAELGEPAKAKQAYYTAIALTGHGSRQLRDSLKQRIHELDRPENR
ncbi:MAG: hypothetical protein KJO57_12085 [Deltaproteobacteria bacterium]|nr:hypothetical protein [Deltaproteobacteria bacterium]